MPRYSVAILRFVVYGAVMDVAAPDEEAAKQTVHRLHREGRFGRIELKHETATYPTYPGLGWREFGDLLHFIKPLEPILPPKETDPYTC